MLDGMPQVQIDIAFGVIIILIYLYLSLPQVNSERNKKKRDSLSQRMFLIGISNFLKSFPSRKEKKTLKM